MNISVTARNAGNGVIAYEMSPSPEMIAVEVSLAVEVAQIGMAKIADALRGSLDYAGAALTSVSFGF